MNFDKIYNENGGNNVTSLIITGCSKRHIFFANQLGKRLNIAGVVSEKKSPAHPENTVPEKSKIISEHFSRRKLAEEKYFPDNSFNLRGIPILEIENKTVNSDYVFQWIKNTGADYIILFGSSIIKDPLMSEFQGKIVNMHLGLSPYYRGSGTNFWPLVHGKPECVGATIHIASSKVDAGPIIRQVRPEGLMAGDNCHDVGCKTIISGTKEMADCISIIAEGNIPPKIQQSNTGLLFKSADLTEDAIITMGNNFSSGMLEAYLREKEKRDALFPIII